MDENFRISLINILKNSKLYYLDLINEKETIYDAKDISDDISEKIEYIDLLLNLQKMNEIIPGFDKIKTDYCSLIQMEEIELNELISKKVLSIDNNDTLDEISNKILNLDNETYNDSMVYKLKKVRRKGIKEEYNFLREN